MNMFQFRKPVDRPTPSVTPSESVDVNLSCYDISKIVRIAEHIAYSLAHLNRHDLTFTCPSISELSRKQIIKAIGDLNVSGAVKRRYNEDFTISLPVTSIYDIRILLFDFEAWLTDASKKLDATGLVFLHVQNDFEHCRLIRRKLSAAAH